MQALLSTGNDTHSATEEETNIMLELNRRDIHRLQVVEVHFHIVRTKLVHAIEVRFLQSSTFCICSSPEITQIEF